MNFDGFNYNVCGGLVYVQSKQKMLLFGGWGASTGCTDNIFEYSLKDKKWKLLNIKIPIKLEWFGYVLFLVVIKG